MYDTIFLERTMCFGNCPAYKLKIDNRGRVDYIGTFCVEVEGEHSWELEKQVVEALNKAILESGYFELKEIVKDYFYRESCQPSCITTITMQDGRNKSIHHYLQSDDDWPEALKGLELKIDELSGVKEYAGN